MEHYRHEALQQLLRHGAAAPLLYFVIFHYVPMYGAQIAFSRLLAVEGSLGSPWVGLDSFVKFFQSWPCVSASRATGQV